MILSPQRWRARSCHGVPPWPTHNLIKPLRHHPTQDLTITHPRVSTNHVRVHAAHDYEHGCYNSFTLCRGYTRYPWVVIILGQPNTHCTDEHPYTLPRCVLGNHNKTIPWFHLACNVPIKISPLAWASHPPRSPLLCLMGSAIAASPTPSHNSAIVASPNIPAVCHRSFPAQLVGTVFMGGRSMNRSLDLGMMTNHRLPASHRTKALNRQHRTGKSQSRHPKSYSPY
jgi:hypothetical protein